MFPSNSFSDLQTLLIGRSSSPFGPTFFDLEDEQVFEQLFFREGQMSEPRNDGDVNAAASLGHMGVDKTIDGVDHAALRPVSPDGILVSKVHAGKKSRSKVAGSRKLKLMPRRRTGKKDRHSKIHTAQGLRDRRIRLSVHIARKFFDLQEMLGLDKASKTIEWLLAESQGAIDELSKNKCLPLNMDSTPESAVVSETKEAEEEEEEEDEEGQETGRSKGRTACEIQIARMRRDLRDKARQRARERTRDKLMMKGLNVEDSMQVHEDGNLNGRLDARILGPPEDLDRVGAHETNSLSIIEKFLGITSTTIKPNSYPDINLGSIIDFLEGHGQPRTPNSVLGSSPNVQN